MNKISKSTSHSVSIENSRRSSIRIRSESAFDIYPFAQNDDDDDVTDYGMKVDLDEWRQEPEKKRRRKGNSDEDDDEFESLSRSVSVSPSPNDIVNQTLSLLPSDALHPNSKDRYKTVTETRKLFIKCVVKFINNEGRSDEKSVKATLAKLRPQSIIIVHGSEEQRKQLRKYCVE